MGRGSNRDNRPRIKPVERIDLSEKRLGLRVALCVIFLLIGVIALSAAVNELLSTDPGWMEITINNSSNLNCSSDFTFYYLLGESELSATVEYKQLRTLYTEAAVKAYQLFSAGESFEGVNNVWYINQHPNEEIVVDEVLYQAFSLIAEYGNRSVYLAPVYAMYDDMFYCENDVQIRDYDPYQNSEMAAYYQEVASFAQSADSIDLVLLGENRIRLNVSAEYLRFAEENGITEYVDFYWMKNAFIIDYMAGLMRSNGFTHGYLSSLDGFFRNLDQSDVTYSFNLYDKTADQLLVIGRASQQHVMGRVFLRNYTIDGQDLPFYYQMENGECRYAYLDAADGLCKSAVNGMICYGESTGCAEILMNMIPVYITDSLDPGAVNALLEKGVYSVYVQNKAVYCNDSDFTVAELYSGYSLVNPNA